MEKKELKYKGLVYNEETKKWDKENIQQDDPRHWRYKKNKDAGILDRMKEEKEAEKKDTLIDYELTVGNEDKTERVDEMIVNADHDSLKALNREHQLAICKSFKLRGFTDKNEEELIKLILKTFKKKRKIVGGVTTLDTLKRGWREREKELAEKKKRNTEENKEEEKK